MTPLESAQITPACREGKGADGAFDEAVERLRQVYDVQRQRWPDSTLVLSITRASAAP